MYPNLRRSDIIEPELSYKVLGVVFDVYNTIGSGYSEIYYQRALAVGLEKSGLRFVREVVLPVSFQNEIIGKQRCDFIVENRMILEIKKNQKFSRSNIEQVLNYLKASGLKLVILINITPKGVIYKRIINSYVRNDS